MEKQVFRIEDWKDENVVMHCKTEEEAKAFCDFLHRNGKTWLSGDSFKTKTNFNIYNAQTIYYFYNGGFGSLNTAQKEGCKILEFSDFVFPDPEESQEAKADKGKPRLSLVPMQIVWDIAEIREYGTKKYKDPENWKRVEMQRYVDALLRHTLAFVENHDSVDEESGLAHYKHMACNMAFICAMMGGDEK